MSERDSAEAERQEQNNATTGSTPESEESTSLLGGIDRRQYLKLGAAAAVGSVAFSGQSTAETRGGVSFDRVVDAVDDLGMDPNGNEPIDSKLDRGWGSGTLIEFPPGEYLVTEHHGYFNDNNVGLVGKTGDRSDVQFVFPDGYNDRFLTVRFGQNWLFGDFTIQQSNDSVTGVGCAFGPDRDATFRNIEIDGFNPRDKQRGLAIVVYDDDGEATLDGYVRTGRSAVGDYPSGTQALLVPKQHEGTLYVRDAHIENAGENGIYASHNPGSVRIEGGYFKNNDIASVRIAGDGSYIKNATFVVDTDGNGNSGSYDNARGLWMETGPGNYVGGLVEDCDFILRSADNSGGLLRIAGDAGDITVRGCRFRNETRFATLFAEPGSDPITVENCSVTGGASNPRRGAIELSRRDGSLVSGCCVSMDGGQNGVVVRNSDGVTVRRSTIDVNGTNLYTPGSSVGTASLSYSGSCPLPDDGGSGAGGNVGGGSEDDGEESSSDDDSDSGSNDTEDTSGGDDSSSTGGSRTLRLTSDDVSPYEFTVSGDLSFDTRFGTEDQLDGSSASGVLVGGTDSYEFSGDITAFDIDGSPTVWLDGETVDPASLGGGSSGGSGSSGDDDSSGSDDDQSGSDDSSSDDGSSGGSAGSMHALRLSGDDVSPYEFTVTGDVDFDPAFGTEDRIDGSTVRGVLAGGTDSYQFTGDISTFDIEGSPTVHLDGETVDPASLGGGSSGSSGGNDGGDAETESSDSTEDQSTDDESQDSSGDGSLANLILLKSDDVSPYELEVSGDIAFDPRYGTEDSTTDDSAKGVLAGGGDAYRFSGDVTTFEVDGDVDVTLNGESVDPASLGN